MNTPLASWHLGLCWMCRNEAVPVTWYGTARYHGGYAPVFACWDCHRWVADRVREYRERTITSPEPNASRDPTPPER